MLNRLRPSARDGVARRDVEPRLQEFKDKQLTEGQGPPAHRVAWPRHLDPRSSAQGEGKGSRTGGCHIQSQLYILYS